MPEEDGTLDVYDEALFFFLSVAIAILKLKGNQRFNGKNVLQLRHQRTLCRMIEEHFPAFADARAGPPLAKPMSSVSAFRSAVSPTLSPPEVLVAHWRSSMGCHPGVWKVRERVTERIQKSQPHFFGKPRRRKGKPVEDRGRNVL